LRFLFDLTSLADWKGPPVGITRVEMELARRARRHLGADLTFCIYDKYRNVILRLDEILASGILSGSLQIRIGAPQAASPPTWRSKLRRLLLRNGTVFRLIQKMRGHGPTRDEVRDLQRAEFEHGSPNTLSAATLEPAELGPDTVVISAGHDWQYKDLRALRRLKDQHRFQYWATVYDLIPILFPHYLVPAYIQTMTEYFRQLPLLCDQVLCISERTRQDWGAFCKDRGFREVRSHTFPLGSDIRSLESEPRARTLPKELMGKRYALYVSTIEARKNHRVLYDAWDECVRGKKISVERDRLVFVGRRGWLVDNLLHEIAVNPATRESIVLLHDVSDADLELIYRESAFVLFPSHYEGFGLPVAEALCHHKPCITSDAGSLPEIGDDLVLRLHPRDTISWTQTIAHFMNAPEELEAWSRRIAKYQATTWDVSAEIFFRTILVNADAD
jgi:glycosyltransferase involved in cell wall biosynthesis